MSNWVDMQVDVLASCPDEINKIEVALQQPCEELLAWAAKRGDQRVEDISEDVRLIVRLTPTRNLGRLDPSLNKARRFENEWKDRSWGLVWSHLYFVSEAFPEAIFLVSYWDTSYAGKSVIRGGREIRHISDRNPQAQGHEWVLLDIFAPYRTEYDIDADFGIFWNAWLIGIDHAVAKLKERYGSPKEGTTCESALLECERKFEKAAECMEHEEGNVSEVRHDRLD